MQGFAPADEVLLFRQKCPKPCSPVRGPLGSSASVPNQDGEGTRSAQTALAEGPIRYGGSAAHEGEETLEELADKISQIQSPVFEITSFQASTIDLTIGK